ncbi:unnamed protein product [Blepharisma stoltei]|uniref:PH domain-containing protein n=1 Tax=Blepharisma stoltei TaxID=1481888 RepID=A0AAU9JY52_9CILI|nr:unnamed protein product [Blepharisma stoltei]
MKGEIRLQNAQVVRHSTNPKRFSIETNTECLQLKAHSNHEAEQWIQALKSLQQEFYKRLSWSPSIATEQQELPEDSSLLNFLALKLGEISGFHAEMQEAVDLIPEKVRSSIPGLQKVLKISSKIKQVALDSLRVIDEEGKKTFPKIKISLINDSENIEKSSFRYSATDINEYQETDRKILFEEECKEIEEIEFEDARSDISDEVEKISNDRQISIVPHRKSLPFLRNPNQKINIWKVVKDSIGKELSKITVPVYFNEPLSFIQRFTEDLTYSEIIERACIENDPQLRLALVACFAVSVYANGTNRTMKPFNPLLGETYELETKGFRLISEQVSHHPPVSAMHCEHLKYIYWGNTEVKTHFKGTYIQAVPHGIFHLVLKETNDHIVWHKPKTNIYNIIMGKIYIDNSGSIEISNFNNGDRATIEYKKKGWFEKVTHELEGSVFDNFGNEKYKIEGKWNEAVIIRNVLSDKVVFGYEINQFPEGYEQSYYFSDYAMQLNSPPDYFINLPKTDSRYRPDQRALENGNLKLAASEKWRLEEKQRHVRKKREERGIEYKPRWFYYDHDEWLYKGGYWDYKNSGDFSDLPDIF